VSAASVQAQDVYRKSNDPYNDRYEDRMYKTGIYADDDFWYGDQQVITKTRFRGMDRNRDGMVTRSEWRGNARSFRNQDWNNDGVLSGREVRARAQRVRNRNTRVEAIDRDRNGRIDRSEWLGSRNDFRRIDRDNDGYITAAEARLRYR
jgi:Ca2+-binding EF-hand superfamily protein